MTKELLQQVLNALVVSLEAVDLHSTAIDEIEAAIALCRAALAQPDVQPMGTAPKDSTVLRLLVKFEENPLLDDLGEPQWTLGHNSFDNTTDDEWQFAGWHWTHDTYTQGKGVPIGWIPLGPLVQVDVQPTLTEELQRKCTNWNAYWRSPDSHGVVITSEQSIELLEYALGVEVELQANTAERSQPAPVTMNEMTLKDGRQGWYLDLPEIYCDVEREQNGQYTVFFRDKDGVEAFAESVVAATEQPAEQPCHCDKNNIGEPGVSCGDCPRDYKQADVEDAPPKLFAVALAQRKWNFLQAAGYKMQKIYFEQDGASGTIDAWGKVVWQPNVIA